MAYDTEWFLNRFSMVTLIGAGLYLIYEGIIYLSMKKNDPSLPGKLTVAAFVAIILGLMEIAAGVLHYWF